MIQIILLLSIVRLVRSLNATLTINHEVVFTSNPVNKIPTNPLGEPWSRAESATHLGVIRGPFTPPLMCVRKGLRAAFTYDSSSMYWGHSVNMHLLHIQQVPFGNGWPREHHGSHRPGAHTHTCTRTHVSASWCCIQGVCKEDFQRRVFFLSFRPPCRDRFNGLPLLQIIWTFQRQPQPLLTSALIEKTWRHVGRRVRILMPWATATVAMETFASAPHVKEPACVKGRRDERDL